MVHLFFSKIIPSIHSIPIICYIQTHTCICLARYMSIRYRSGWHYSLWREERKEKNENCAAAIDLLKVKRQPDLQRILVYHELSECLSPTNKKCKHSTGMLSLMFMENHARFLLGKLLLLCIQLFKKTIEMNTLSKKLLDSCHVTMKSFYFIKLLIRKV